MAPTHVAMTCLVPAKVFVLYVGRPCFETFCTILVYDPQFAPPQHRRWRRSYSPRLDSRSVALVAHSLRIHRESAEIAYRVGVYNLGGRGFI